MQRSRPAIAAAKARIVVEKSPSLGGNRVRGQLTSVLRPDGLTVDFAYDSAGRLSSITTPSGMSTYSYDSTTGKLSSISAPGGVTLSYTWDGWQLKDTAWAGAVAGTVSRSYNNDFDVASITVAGTSFSFTRDNDQLLTAAGAMSIARDATTGFVTGTTLGSVSTGRTYSSFGALATTSASAGSTPLFATSTTRDALGRITELVETVQGVTTTWSYEYNAAGQLWRVRLDGVQVAEYQYDLNGNRLSVTDELGVTTSGSYDAQDRLSTYGGASYSYTLNGELQSKTVPGVGTTTFSYDAFGNLRASTLPDGMALDYVIDGKNRRIGRKVNGVIVQGFLYRRGRVVAELDASGAVVSRFVYATKRHAPDYMIRDGITYRIITDHLGSPRLVVDASGGAVIQRMDFDEWGRVTQDTSPGFQPFGFAGGLYDRVTKLVRFGHRDYDAGAARWTARDPLGLRGRSTNVYVYAQNDPVNAIDPTGLEAAGCDAGDGEDDDGEDDDLDYGYFGVGEAGGEEGSDGLSGGGLGDVGGQSVGDGGGGGAGGLSDDYNYDKGYCISAGCPTTANCTKFGFSNCPIFKCKKGCCGGILVQLTCIYKCTGFKPKVAFVLLQKYPWGWNRRCFAAIP